MMLQQLPGHQLTVCGSHLHLLVGSLFVDTCVAGFAQ